MPIPFRDSLSYKVSFKILIAYFALTIGLLILISGVVQRSFRVLEDTNLLQSRSLVQRVLGLERETLSALCQEYSAWDETWDFLDGKNPKYIEYNFTQEYLKRSDLDLLMFLRADGSIAWGRSLKSGTIQEPVTEDQLEEHKRISSLIHQNAAEYEAKGPSAIFVSSARGSLVVAVSPVLRSDFSGIPHGFVVFGRILGADRLEKLAALTNTALTMADMSPELAEKLETDPRLSIRRDADRIAVPIAFRYAGERGGVVLNVSLERDLWRLGQESLIYLALVVAIAGLVIVLVLIVVMRRSVLNPIKALAAHIGGITGHEDFTLFFPTDRTDELGILASTYNRLLERIANLLVEKEFFLKEVHHRIKNNMSVVASVLNLHRSTLTDTVAIAAVEDARNRVQSMMVLYEKLYNSTDFASVSARKFLLSLIDEILKNFPLSASVQVENRIGDFILDARNLQPIGIIVNEIVTNIMKYAFAGRDGGTITVVAERTGDSISIAIADDGVGIPESVDFEKSTGFGLMLVANLARQIKGTIRIVRDNGTKFVLEFEEPKRSHIP